jgi:glycogen phosphorylase
LSADVLTDVTVQDLELAESCDGSRYRFDGPIVLDRGGAFGYNLRVIPGNDLLTSVAEPGVVAVDCGAVVVVPLPFWSVVDRGRSR